MFYLIYVIFLFVVHNGLSTAIGAAPWGAARLGAALDSRTADGPIGEGSRGGADSCGGCSRRAGHPREARGPRGGSRGAGWVIVRGRW
jgi:hypothetical protein